MPSKLPRWVPWVDAMQCSPLQRRHLVDRTLQATTGELVRSHARTEDGGVEGLGELRARLELRGGIVGKLDFSREKINSGKPRRHGSIFGHQFVLVG